jgi:hypothetical protein
VEGLASTADGGVDRMRERIGGLHAKRARARQLT